MKYDDWIHLIEGEMRTIPSQLDVSMHHMHAFELTHAGRLSTADVFSDMQGQTVPPVGIHAHLFLSVVQIDARKLQSPWCRNTGCSVADHASMICLIVHMQACLMACGELLQVPPSTPAYEHGK